MINIYKSKCIADTIELSCNSTSFLRHQNSVCNNPNAKKVLMGKDFKPKKDSYIGRIGKDKSPFVMQEERNTKMDSGPMTGLKLIDDGLL